MSAICSVMTAHHARCDDLFTALEDVLAEGRSSDAKPALQGLREELERHLQAEETVLFPAFESAIGMQAGPTVVMRQEHQRMRALLEQIALALQAQDPERADGYVATLAIMMKQHNLKEETALYPMCDAALGEGARGLAARLDLG